MWLHVSYLLKPSQAAGNDDRVTVCVTTGLRRDNPKKKDYMLYAQSTNMLLGLPHEARGFPRSRLTAVT